jgi:hypothetical protein
LLLKLLPVHGINPPTLSSYPGNKARSNAFRNKKLLNPQRGPKKGTDLVCPFFHPN